MDVLQFIELFLDHEDDGIVDDEDTFPSIAVALTTRRREHVPKVIGFVEDVVPNYSNADFRSDFRIGAPIFDILLGMNAILMI